MTAREAFPELAEIEQNAEDYVSAFVARVTAALDEIDALVARRNRFPR